MSFLHTYSITARDEASGQLGVAVQSHWFAVGMLCPWVEAGVGAVATQSMVEVSYGPLGLAALREGKSAQDALRELLAQDENRELRQVAIVDAQGCADAHTGSRCISAAGHQTGRGYSVQANMMVDDSVWPAMAAAYESACGSLAQRMLAALKAAQAAGGDIRGRQSACLLVADGVRSDQPWKHLLVDLRVDDSPDPLAELERLLDIHNAYELMNAGDEAMTRRESQLAREKYTQAAALAPHIDEIPFWQAVTLADSDNLDEALPIFRQVFAANPNWAELVQRLPASGLLKDDAGMMAKILSMKDR
jgi:uncharacterized Ntn-hydrolase superfamily protein